MGRLPALPGRDGLRSGPRPERAVRSRSSGPCFPFTQQLDRATFVEQIASRSYVQVLPESERAALLAEIADFASTLDEPISLPYLTDLFCAGPVVSR